MPETQQATISDEARDSMDRLFGQRKLSDDAKESLFRINPNAESIPVLTEAQVSQIGDAQRAALELSSVPVGASAEDQTGVISDVARAVGRTAFGTLSGAASLPRVAVEALPGDQQGGMLDYIVGISTDKAATMFDFAANSEILAPDEGSEVLFTGEWWSNRFPELASSAVIALVPGMGATKVARATGFSQKAAASFGRATSIALLSASEAGSTYHDLVYQLRAQGVPDAEARDIASRGALAYGVVSGGIESGLLSFTGRSASRGLLMRIIRGGVGEMAEEEAQLLAQWAMVAIVEKHQGVELRDVLTTQNVIESGIGAFAGGAMLGPFSATAFTLQDVSDQTGIPVETLEKITADRIEADPNQTLETEETESAPTTSEPSPAPTAPTEPAQSAPAATGEGVLKTDETTESTVSEPGIGKLPHAQEPTSRAERASEAQKEASIRQADLTSRLRQENKNSRVADLIEVVTGNLPGILTKEQALSIVEQANKATTQKQLQAVIKKINTLKAKARTKQAQDRLVEVMEAVDPAALPPESRESVQAVIDALDTQKLSPKKRAALESLKDYLKRGGDVPNQVKEGLKRLDKKAVSELTEGEATEIADEISSLVNQAKLAQTIRTKRGKRQLARAIETITDEITKRGSKIREWYKQFREGGGAVTDAFRLFIGTSLNQEYASTLESLLELLSGSDQTVTSDVLFGQVFDANRTMLGRIRRLKAERAAFMQSLGVSDAQWLTWLRPRGNLLTRTLEMLGHRQPDIGAEVIELPSGRTVRMYKAERTSFLEQMMDTETGDLILYDEVPVQLPGMAEGESIVLSPDDINAILESATAQERALARWNVETYNGQEADDFGEATRIQSGRSSVRPGRYVRRVRVNDKPDTDFDARFFRQRAIRNAGVNLERNPHDKTNPIKLIDTFSNFDSWATMHSAIIELAPSVEQALKVVQSKDFKNAIVNQYGKRTHQAILARYNELMRETVGGSPNSELIGRNARAVFNRISRGLLFFSPQVGAYQAGSYFTLMTEMKSADVNRAIAQGAFADTALDKEIDEHDPWLANRTEGGAVTLVETTARDDPRALQHFRVKAGAARVADMAGGGMIKGVDSAVIRVAWASAKHQAQREGYSGEDFWGRVVQLADKAIRRTQPTWDPLTISGLAVEARTSAFARLLNFFRAMRAKNVDMTRMMIARAFRGQISKRELARQMVLVNVAQPLYITGVRWAWGSLIGAGAAGMAYALTGRARDDDDEKDARDEAKSFLLDAFSTVSTNFVFGDIPDGIIRTLFKERSFDVQISPFSSIVTGLSRSMGGMAAGARDMDIKKFVKGSIMASNGVLVLLGIPPGPIDNLAIQTLDELDKRDGGGKRRSSGARGSR